MDADVCFILGMGLLAVWWLREVLRGDFVSFRWEIVLLIKYIVDSD